MYSCPNLTFETISMYCFTCHSIRSFVEYELSFLPKIKALVVLCYFTVAFILLYGIYPYVRNIIIHFTKEENYNILNELQLVITVLPCCLHVMPHFIGFGNSHPHFAAVTFITSQKTPGKLKPLIR